MALATQQQQQLKGKGRQEGERVGDRDAEGQPIPARATGVQREDYSNAPKEPPADTREDRQPKEQEMPPRPLTAQTAPSPKLRQRPSRPKAVKRTATGAQVNDNPREPFPYTFDPLSSESDSTSSSDDEQATTAARRRQDGEERQQKRKAQSSAKDPQEKEQERKGQSYSRFAIGNDWFRTKGRVSKRDGRLKITISETANYGYVAKALGQSIRNHLNVPAKDHKQDRRPSMMQSSAVDGGEVDSIGSHTAQGIPRPRLNIVIMVIGSRGDIQPFLQVGKILKHKYGHRVRIASHPTFREFVEKEAGLEFFSVGGDPSALMAFMVKNPGLIPSLQTVRDGEIPKRRNAMATMFNGFWRACIQTSDDPKDHANLRLQGEKSPFIVDAIIANPPSMAHVHIAEKLGVPLHIMFTFPYTPTTAFPHPLANIKARRNNVDADYVNFMSYPLVEMMTWQGLGDIVNKFRANTLGLEPVSSLWAPGALYRMKVPYTYMWSPSLVPKPYDWGPEIDLAGFVFLDLASDFKPPQDLVDFLDAGLPPIYVGFGSIVVDDPNGLTDLIFKAAEMAGVRVLVNKGWGGLGQDNSNTPDNVFMLENTPHDWLFPRVKAVVHHGGAGTTAIGLKLGKPTMIVPFFGDQPFWGARVAEAKAGAHECVSYKKLTAERLAEGIKQCLTEEAQHEAQKIADSIAKEGDGAENAVKSFQRSLPLAGRSSMRCSILQDHVAVWRVRNSSLRLSALAAQILLQGGKLQWSNLKLLRHYEWNDFDGPGGPFTGGAGALSSSLYEMGAGFGMVPMRIAKHLREHEERERKKKERQQRREERQKRRADRLAIDAHVGVENPTNTTTAETADQTAGRPAATRHETTTTQASTLSAGHEPLPQALLSDFGHGIKRTGAALLTMPNDFSLAIAQGFHNTPRLYGDATVRKPVRITGIKSGCLAARKEFTHGVADAWTGLVTQPKGDWEDAETLPAKFAGLGTGFGKGVGGFVLKNLSAVISPPAFVGQGIIKAIESKSRGPGSKAYVRRAHQIQGQNGLAALELEDPSGEKGLVNDTRDSVMQGWQVYEELWALASERYTGMVGKVRLSRTRRHWFESGALENVDTARRALETFKRGENLEGLLKRHERGVREAEKARAPAMVVDSEGEEEEAESAQGGGGDEQNKDGKGDRSEDADYNRAAPPSSEDGSESTMVGGVDFNQGTGQLGKVFKAMDMRDTVDAHAPAGVTTA